MDSLNLGLRTCQLLHFESLQVTYVDGPEVLHSKLGACATAPPSHEIEVCGRRESCRKHVVPPRSCLTDLAIVPRVAAEASCGSRLLNWDSVLVWVAGSYKPLCCLTANAESHGTSIRGEATF